MMGHLFKTLRREKRRHTPRALATRFRPHLHPECAIANAALSTSASLPIEPSAACNLPNAQASRPAFYQQRRDAAAPR